MHLQMRALAHTIDQSLFTARELNLETVEQLLAMASLELSLRVQIIEDEARERPRRTA
ncbi:hypothetical protein [Undibacter mobilis]|uniref:hypothetical protein n=1 Tax=Undibacter mobilis TaxID=2292256 RepID=UPI00143CFFB3|nr:hypothetical protein [Undibacter mobilis]